MPYKDPERQREALRLSARRGTEERNAVVTEFKASRGCEYCGEHDIVVLDLHHKNQAEKDGEISKMVHQRKPIARIVAEMEKCRVLCANCHRREHHRLRAGMD